MIITKTPYRMSFFGGGTDYPSHYLNYGGTVLASTINKYCYISCRNLPPFFDHKFRVAYSEIETTKAVPEIKHPAVRGVLEFFQIEEGLEVQHHGDLPARSGLGSSSSFTAGLIHAIYALQGKTISKHDLAIQTIEIEQNVIGEKVGSQDQVMASYGGFNHIIFSNDGDIAVNPVSITKQRKNSLNQHLMMFFSGILRDSQTITHDKINEIIKKPEQVNRMGEMVDQAIALLTSDACITDFGNLLHETWMLKKSISKNISTTFIDTIYNTALREGALGGKLLGAGGGGFLVLFATPDRQPQIRKALSNFIEVPFEFEDTGSTICVNEPHGL
ncbi:MAG: kinase [Flavobacteriaceae bacterium]|nr:kinase [Flavobacteriaceae bacterium]